MRDLDDYRCTICGNCHELCFCEEDRRCMICQQMDCVCETIELDPLPSMPGLEPKNLTT